MSSRSPISLKKNRIALHERRSLIGVRQAERRQLAEQISQLNQMAPNVFAAASALDAVARSSSLEALREAATTFVERALELASRLEGATNLTDRLVELERSLAALQHDLHDVAAVEEGLRRELAKLLQSMKRPAQKRSSSRCSGWTRRDPRFEKLRSLHADWEVRFGRHPAFNGALLASVDVVAATCVGLAGVPALPMSLSTLHH